VAQVEVRQTEIPKIVQIRPEEVVQEVPITLHEERPREEPQVQDVEVMTQVIAPDVRFVDKAIPCVQTEAIEKLVKVQQAPLIQEHPVPVPQVQMVEAIREEHVEFIQRAVKHVPKPTMEYVERVVEYRDEYLTQAMPLMRPGGRMAGRAPVVREASQISTRPASPYGSRVGSMNLRPASPSGSRIGFSSGVGVGGPTPRPPPSSGEAEVYELDRDRPPPRAGSPHRVRPPRDGSPLRRSEDRRVLGGLQALQGATSPPTRLGAHAMTVPPTRYNEPATVPVTHRVPATQRGGHDRPATMAR